MEDLDFACQLLGEPYPGDGEDLWTEEEDARWDELPVVCDPYVNCWPKAAETSPKSGAKIACW